MPLWKIYHPPGGLLDRAKEGNRGEDYQHLPRAAAVLRRVIYQEVAEKSFYVGGEPANDFVRIWVDHVARQFDSEEIKGRSLAAIGRILEPYLGERKLRWEMHVDETPFDLWTIQGIRPPKPNTEHEKRWRDENKPSPVTPQPESHP